MMKTLLLILVFCITQVDLQAQKLGIIESKSANDIYALVEQETIHVHFYKPEFAIISGEYKGSLPYSILEENGFKNEYNYLIYASKQTEIAKLKESILGIGDLLFTNQSISVLRIRKEMLKQFKPLANDALFFFNEDRALIADPVRSKMSSEVILSQDIEFMLNEVNTDSIEATISYLSSYSTRYCFSSQIIDALHWIRSKFESYGLTVNTQSLSIYGIPSFNVIAIQEGTVVADPKSEQGNTTEYVVVGGHADSFSNYGDAPGADDNASGVAGILEIARILSKNNFDRTIIYCAFSGEEIGLYGSKYFADLYKNNNENIIGYVNLDMIGYKDPGQALSTSLIYPSQAKPLADFYKNICSTYLPNFVIIDGTLVNADSDHTSFNQAGYMGIFPFENLEHYSPYIHTNSDILGLSVNSFELAENLTKAALASVASLADNNTRVSSQNNLIVANDFKVYPNPASTELRIQVDGLKNIELELYNMLGELILRKTIEESDIVDVSTLAPGIYLVKLTSGIHSKIKKCVIR